MSIHLSDLTWPTAFVALFFTVLAWSLIHTKTSKNVSNKSESDNPALMESSKGLNVAYQDIIVSKLLIHPIKSCRGVSVQSCRYTPEGLENDRRFCIVEADSHKIITARDVGKMVLITPRIEVDENSPHGGLLSVSFPEDSGCESFSVPLYPIQDKWEQVYIDMWGKVDIDGYICESAIPNSSGRSPSAILSEYFGRPVHLTVKGNKPRACDPTDSFPALKATAWYQDGYPLLVLSEESIDVLHEEIRSRVGTLGIEDQWSERQFVIERFRPNIVLRGGGPFTEDNFEEISIGKNSENSPPGILLVSKCIRCLLPNVSPDTGVRDKAVPYKVLMKFRIGIDPQNKMGPCLGCNGVPLGSGMVRVGDAINVRKMIVT